MAKEKFFTMKNPNKRANPRTVRVNEDRAERLASRGWTEVGSSKKKAKDDGGGGDGKPGAKASKADWVEYADSLGISTDEMTKAEIIEAVEAKASEE